MQWALKSYTGRYSASVRYGVNPCCSRKKAISGKNLDVWKRRDKQLERIQCRGIVLDDKDNKSVIVQAGAWTVAYGSDALARKVQQVLETQQKRNATAAAHIPQPSAIVVDKKRVSDPAPAGLHVLLCEDDDLIRSTVKDMLEFRSYAVTDAGSAVEALRLWTIHEADILITYIGLLDISGVEHARMIREKAPDLLFIFAISRFDDPPVALSGQSKTLIKPYGIEKLIEAIRTLTGQKKW
ncbi:response regulator [Rhodanobacter sp. A1T4]|uniref:response regulator n=1 Tax=Rhodanobacter sp. A1T4 TaxID=2723087 RepID=UPI001618C625|nr:response regulator [Rhodanobacter sp. A1T4]MBB6249004.1 CheY-like chemotaxis protein [Rhodanobacter sp. A1T4]